MKLQEKAPVEVRGLAFLAFIPQLAPYRNLSLEKNYFTHVPADIMQLTSLTVLSLDHCKLLYVRQHQFVAFFTLLALAVPGVT